MMSSNPRPCRVAVLGGGVTGLTAAYMLASARRRGAAVDEFLLEARDVLGGLIQTEDAGGFTIEAGPDSFLTAKSEAADLCRELGLELTGSNDGSRRTLVLRKSRLEPLPAGLVYFVPTRIGPALGSRLISLAGKAAILRDTFRRPAPAGRNRGEDESAASFVRRHLGQDVAETIAGPLIEAVYGGDAERLSAGAILPRFVAMERERGSLVRAMRELRGSSGEAGPVFTTLKRGMAGLTRALAERIGAGSAAPRIFLNQSVESIEARPRETNGGWPRAGGYEISTTSGGCYHADAIIMALPAFVCSKLLAKISSAASRELAAISYTPAIVVALAYPGLSKALPKGFGFLVPRKEKRHLIACTFVQSKFPARTPTGAALLRCFLGGDRDPEAASRSPDELAAMAEDEVAEILAIRSQPSARRVWRWTAAMPQYEVGHLGRVARIERAIGEQPGLFLAGNAYSGVGIPDCIRSAKEAARRACEFAAAL